MKHLHPGTQLLAVRDELVTTTLHVQQLRVYINDDVLETISTLEVHLDTALLTIKHGLDDLRKKYEQDNR